MINSFFELSLTFVLHIIFIFQGIFFRFQNFLSQMNSFTIMFFCWQFFWNFSNMFQSYTEFWHFLNSTLKKGLLFQNVVVLLWYHPFWVSARLFWSFVGREWHIFYRRQFFWTKFSIKSQKLWLYLKKCFI